MLAVKNNGWSSLKKRVLSQQYSSLTVRCTVLKEWFILVSAQWVKRTPSSAINNPPVIRPPSTLLPLAFKQTKLLQLLSQWGFLRNILQCYCCSTLYCLGWVLRFFSADGMLTLLFIVQTTANPSLQIKTRQDVLVTLVLLTRYGLKLDKYTSNIMGKSHMPFLS